MGRRLLDLLTVDVDWIPTVAPALVEKRVVQDGVEPGPEVGARAELPGKAERLDVGLLHQILGVGRVACQPYRGPVQAVDVGQRTTGDRRGP